MPRKQAKKVTSIDDAKAATRERELDFAAEVLTKDDPSPEARAYFDERVRTDPSWRKFGDLTAEALDLGLKKFWLGYATKRGVVVAAEDLKAELGHAEASPVERLMIEHAVMCHVRLGMVEHLYSRQDSTRIEAIEHWERRLTAAQRRFTRAVTTLARVRALLARAEAAQEAAARSRSGRPTAVLNQKTA